ncbi:hypothetical protein [Maritalea porphyrae]|uniref:Sap-like sulfolipid-1-addressing protein n=1 Tax=Maritalea porphyrae TaxID=880732 RepID=A0ABQ5UMD9_9HYPH|nr:hypothetical protein [Maritalea porphyrae]GLQ16451.1 hypothetical protein GCM10007879_07000 [Maritalea porphyrae]
MKSFLLVFTFGIAGIDPMGLTLLLAGIASGVKKRQVAAFGLATFFGTILLGVLFSLFGGQITDWIRPLVPQANDPSWAMAEIAVALLIGYWLFTHITARSRTHDNTEGRESGRPSSVFGMAVSGFAFSLSAVPDPAFLATAVIASQTSSLPKMIIMHSIWVLVSQILLFAFIAAYLLDAHEPLKDFVRPIWESVKRPVIGALYVGIGALCFGMAIDAIALFATGEYLVRL